MEIIFNGIIKFFQFCGLSPVAVPDPEKNNSNHRSTAVADTSLLIWSILIAVPLFVYVILCALYYQELMDMFGSMGKVNAGAKGGAIIVTHCVVSFEAIWSRRSQCVIWQKLYAVDGLLKEIGVNVQQLQRGFYRNYSWKFVGYSTFTLGSELIIYFVVSNNPEWSRFWLATIVSLMVIRWKHLQHVLYVDVLTSRFGVIRQELERISARSKVVMSTELLEHMKRLMGAYTLLYDMSDRLGRTCNLSQLANLTQNFVQLSGDLYWMYSMLYRNLFNTLPEIFLGLLPTFVALNTVMYSCEQCFHEVDFIGFLLHNIQRHEKYHQLDLLIENFSLQILHEPIVFPVAGFFNLDFMLLKSMVASITTYMVIFIQFMPKDEAAAVDIAIVDDTSLMTLVLNETHT